MFVWSTQWGCSWLREADFRLDYSFGILAERHVETLAPAGILRAARVVGQWDGILATEHLAHVGTRAIARKLSNLSIAGSKRTIALAAQSDSHTFSSGSTQTA